MFTKRIKNNKGQYINRRKRQMIFRKLYMAIGTFLLCSIIAISSSHIITNAKSAVYEPVIYKYFDDITIYPGDSLYDLAIKYNKPGRAIEDYIKEIKNINHMTDDELISGQSLIIIYYSEEYM